MTGLPEYLTIKDAAAWAHRGERTIKRWMTARLLATYRRQADGALMVASKELMLVERSMRHRNVAASRAGRPRRAMSGRGIDAGS